MGVALILGATALFSSCRDPKPEPNPDPIQEAAAPVYANVLGGNTLAVLDFEQQAGATTTYNEETRVITATPKSGAITARTYYFDAKGTLRFLTVEYSSFEEQAKSLELAVAQLGWKEDASLKYPGQATYEKTYTAGNTRVRVNTQASQALPKPVLLVEAAAQEGITDWTRTDNLAGASGKLVLPFLAFDAPALLAERFEAGYGHKSLGQEAGESVRVIKFDASVASVKETRYTVGAAGTITQVTLLLDRTMAPTVGQMEDYFTGLGFTKESFEPEEGPFYTLAQGNVHVQILTPATGDWALNFTTGELPKPGTSDEFALFFPINRFYELDMEEAIAEYEKAGYKVERTDTYEPKMPEVITGNKYFPRLQLSDLYDVYFAASLITEDPEVINDPRVAQLLQQAGYVHLAEDPLPTYMNYDEEIKVMIDINAEFGSHPQEGKNKYYSINFESTREPF